MKDGKYLTVEITKVKARGGGAFTGPKRMTVRGTLIENGKEIADFEAERGAMEAAGTCSTLREVREGAGRRHRAVAPAAEAPRPAGRQEAAARDARRARCRTGASVTTGSRRDEQSKSEKPKGRATPVRRDAQGRAHLVIHRDEYGTAGRRWRLTQPLFDDQWQNDRRGRRPPARRTRT